MRITSLTDTRNKGFFPQPTPSFKISIRIAQQLGVKGAHLEFGKPLFDIGLKTAPRGVASNISGKSNYWVLRVFAAVIQIANEHDYASPVQEVGGC
jgi:hypothetical protein